MDFLRSGYRTTMRFFIGGQAYDAPVRWYLTSPSAKYFPGGTCYYSRVWLQADEVDLGGPGEITDLKGLTRPGNHGYLGQCHLGRREWYHTGQLPADLFSRTPEPVPACCRGPHVVGPILLSGEITALALTPGAGSYGSSGGSAAPQDVGRVQGPIQLAGSVTAIAVEFGPGMSSGSYGGSSAPQDVGLVEGPIQLAGSVTAVAVYPGPSGSGSSGGSMGSGPTSQPSGPMSSGPSGSFAEVGGCALCPDSVAAAQFSVTFGALINGTCTDCANLAAPVIMSYGGGCTWNILVPICGTEQVGMLTIFGGFVGLSLVSASVTYRAPLGSWDCLSPLTLTLQGFGVECLGWPVTVTITPE